LSSLFFLFLTILNLNKLNNNSFALGPHTIAMFFPLLGSVLYLLFNYNFTNYKSKTVFLNSIIMFLLLIIPFINVFDNQITHKYGDDSYTFSLIANKMIENRTLNGSPPDVIDQKKINLLNGQPGYRYYIALSILLFGKENRGVQLANMFLFFFSLAFFLYTVKPILNNRQFQILSLFLLLITPYTIKNSMMQYSEWLAITLAMIFVTTYFKERYIIAAISLGLISFIRTNLLLSTAFICLLIYIKNRQLVFLFTYLGTILLPLYHNIYYAGKWIFISTYASILPGSPSLELLLNIDWLSTNLGKMLFAITCKILQHTIGYPFFDVYVESIPYEFRQIIFGFLFIPLGVFTIFFFLVDKKPNILLIMFCLIILTVSPTIFFGWGSFPRFEFANFSIIILFIIFLQEKLIKSNNKLTNTIGGTN